MPLQARHSLVPWAGHEVANGSVWSPLRPNERWRLDFVSDQLTDGRRFRILTVVDDCTRATPRHA